MSWLGLMTNSSTSTNQSPPPRRQSVNRLFDMVVFPIEGGASTDFESWVKESREIGVKFAYRNGGRIGIPRGGNQDCRDVQSAPVLPVEYVVSASRIADRRMIL